MAAKRKPVVELKADDISLAAGVAEKFNIAARSSKAGQVSRVLARAAEFLSSVAAGTAAGDTIHVGSEWHDDVFLDQKKVSSLLRKDDLSLGLSKNVVSAKKTKDDLETVRQAFNLASEREAAHLCLEAYSRLRDGLWRGNGFWMETAKGEEKPFNARKFAPKGKGKAAPAKRPAKKAVPKNGE